MRLFAKLSLALAAALLLVAATPAIKADTITISTGGFNLRNLGNDGTGRPGLDSLVGAPVSNSTYAITGSGTFHQALNQLIFTTGFTGLNSGGPHPFTFSQAITINGQTQILDLVGRLDIDHLVDTVHILSATPLTFNFNTFSSVVEVLPTSIEGCGAGNFWGEIDARITLNTHNNPVPEPATLTLLGLGLAGVAAKMRRRRRSKIA